jgi:hypothetical protein
MKESSVFLLVFTVGLYVPFKVHKARGECQERTKTEKRKMKYCDNERSDTSRKSLAFSFQCHHQIQIHKKLTKKKQHFHLDGKTN